MFGFRGGESESDLARLTGYRADAQQKWPTLTYLDLSQIKNEAQLVSKIGERYSLPPAQAQAEVTAKIAGPDGPEYRIRSLDGGLEAVVAERELTYSRAAASTVPGSLR